MASTFTFIVSIPDQDPVLHELEGEKITFGRGPDNGIQILVSEVSVQHGEFVQGGPGYKIVDNGSTNGTKVNGARVDSSGQPLAPMDKISLGETISAYFVPSAALESTSVPDIIKSIESSPKTAPVATAAPAAGAPAPGVGAPAPVRPALVAPGGLKPAPVQPAAVAPGAATVKLDQVRPSAGGGPARPPGAPAAAPAAAPRPPVAAPGPPAGAPAAPGGAPAPQPVSPTPLTRPSAPGQAPNIPLPGAKKEEE